MQRNFTEVVFEGHYNTIKGFIEGFQAGMGTDYRYFFSSDFEIEAETFADHIKDWISLGNKLHHIIMDADLFKKIDEAISAGVDSSLVNRTSIKSSKPVKGASFSFKFVTYGRKYAEEIKEILGRLPEGVSLADYKPVEEIDEECREVELYTPCHDYVFQGSGILSGPVEQVIPLRKTLEDHPLIEAEKVRLSF